MHTLRFLIVALLNCIVCKIYANDYSIDFVDGKNDGYDQVISFSKEGCSCGEGIGKEYDDGFYLVEEEGFELEYMGSSFKDKFYMNINGAITFDEESEGPICCYITKDLSTLNRNIIAGYWCDIDLSKCSKEKGGMYVKKIKSGNKTKAIKFLWYKVGAFGISGKYLTFQITLVNKEFCNEGDNNIFFCYETIDFTCGSVSQGKPAIVGISTKDNFFQIGSYSKEEDAREALLNGNSQCKEYDLKNTIVVTPSQTCKDGFFTIEVFKSISESCTLIYDRGEIGEDRNTIETSQCEFKYPADGEEHTIVVLKDNETLYEGKINAPKCTSCSAEDWRLNINGEDLAASYCSNKVLSFSAKPKSGVELTNPKYIWSFSNSESSDMTTPEKTYTVARKESVSVKITSDECKEGIELSHSFDIDVCPVEQVCPTEFAPTAGKKYILSGWMHVDGANNEISYEDYGSIKVQYEGSEQVDEGIPSGDIIDGWQRIYKEVLIPEKATKLNFELVSKKGNDCYFDDIRFHPVDASMVSYVYDPVTLRLVAELDNENYATFYEYDEEGAMIRVKKETERGIMTIKEARQGGVKTK